MRRLTQVSLHAANASLAEQFIPIVKYFVPVKCAPKFSHPCAFLYIVVAVIE